VFFNFSKVSAVPRLGTADLKIGIFLFFYLTIIQLDFNCEFEKISINIPGFE